MNFQEGLDDRDVVLQFSRLGSFGHAGEFCHLAESALLSHDVVSDDFTWPTPDLIVRLYLLAGIRQGGVAQLLVHLQSLEVYTFEPLLLLVPASLAHRRATARSCSPGFKPI